MRSGDIGDEAAWSAEEAELPLDLDALRADDDLIEALAAGLVPPPSGPRDPDDVEGELVALLAGWVADVRPETLLHRPDEPPATRPDKRPAAVRVLESVGGEARADAAAAAYGPVSLLEYDELPEPVALSGWRSRGLRPYVTRAAAALVATLLVGSGIIAGSYDAHPGEPLWVVAQMVFPAKSHSVEAATAVSTALNTARVALQGGRIDEARLAFQTVEAQLDAVDDADGHAELAQQTSYLTSQLSPAAAASAQQVDLTPRDGRPIATGQAGAVIPASPTVTPGATRALSTPSAATGPTVLAAAPQEGATSAGAPAVDASAPPPAVLAAPPGPAAPAAPSDPIASAPPPAVSDPAASAPAPASGGSSSPPPVAEPPAAPATTDPPASPDPQTPPPSPSPPPPTTDPASDTGTTQDNTGSVVDSATTDYGAASTGSGTDSSASTDSSSSGGSSSSGSSADVSASADISADGSAGSTLGNVAGVVSSAGNSS